MKSPKPNYSRMAGVAYNRITENKRGFTRDQLLVMLAAADRLAAISEGRSVSTIPTPTFVTGTKTQVQEEAAEKASVIPTSNSLVEELRAMKKTGGDDAATSDS